jgi:hypothetical protein
MVEKIKKFEKVIKENKTGMLQITILYNMSCHENYNKLTDEEKEKLLGFLYCLYLKDETSTDLGAFSNVVMNNYLKVLNNKIDKTNIYNYI